MNDLDPRKPEDVEAIAAALDRARPLVAPDLAVLLEEAARMLRGLEERLSALEGSRGFSDS